MTSHTAMQDGATATTKQQSPAHVKSTITPRKPNPLWKYMGFGENFHPRLPSRNWMTFLTIVGSFGAAVVYDKREKKRTQKKWCKLVEHIAKQPLDSREMPRKLAILLEAPPMDGLRSAQDHFKEYVKPILVSSGLDWEFVQGRKEGDIRAKVSERIRYSRLPMELRAEKDCVAHFRLKNGINEFEGLGGDIILGRNTWKEYIQGIHEGWLAPPTKPSDIVPASQNEIQEIGSSIVSVKTLESKLSNGTPTDAKSIESLQTSVPSPHYIDILHYSTAPLPNDIPDMIQPSVPISFPHLLGFLNTPKRIHRFLNRRKLADRIGRETAAAILANYRPYHNFAEQPQSEFLTESHNEQADDLGSNKFSLTEQQTALQDEEKDWHKSVWVQADGEPKCIWSRPPILDPRIATRMRRFELSLEDEERANKIEVLEEEIEGWIKGSIRRLWRAGKAYIR